MVNKFCICNDVIVIMFNEVLEKVVIVMVNRSSSFRSYFLNDMYKNLCLVANNG